METKSAWKEYPAGNEIQAHFCSNLQLDCIASWKYFPAETFASWKTGLGSYLVPSAGNQPGSMLALAAPALTWEVPEAEIVILVFLVPQATFFFNLVNVIKLMQTLRAFHLQ